jgi:hypothetical protein
MMRVANQTLKYNESVNTGKNIFGSLLTLSGLERITDQGLDGHIRRRTLYQHVTEILGEQNLRQFNSSVVEHVRRVRQRTFHQHGPEVLDVTLQLEVEIPRRSPDFRRNLVERRVLCDEPVGHVTNVVDNFLKLRKCQCLRS